MAREKTFVVTSNNQYIQNIKLDAGKHTLTCNVKSHAEKLTVGFQTEGGSWVLYNIPILPGVWNKRAKLTFVLAEKTVRFSLCADDASTATPIYIQLPMLEEGSNASTPKPNERDIEEDVSDTRDYEWIFTRTKTPIPPERPESVNTDDYVPEGWDDDATSANEEFPFQWSCKRTKSGNVWGEYSDPFLFSNYSKDGVSGYSVILSRDSHTFQESKDMPGVVDPNIEVPVDIYVFKGGTRINVHALFISVTGLPFGMTYTKAENKVTFITGSGSGTGYLSTSATYSITIVIDGITFTKYFSHSIAWRGDNGTPGEDGHSPYIGENGNWWVWDANQKKYIDSGDSAHGDDGHSPYIGTNGNWWVWDANQKKYVDSGIKAEGTPGEDGITLLLTNESHIFAGSATTALAGSATTDVIAYKGGSQVTPSSITVGTKPTGMTSSVSGNRITFTVTTAMESASGMIPITIVINGVSYTKYFTYSISFKGTDGKPGTPGADGADGADGLSKGIYLNAATNIIRYNAAGTPTPATNFTVEGTAVNTTITTWQYSVNGGAFSSSLPAGVSRSGNTVTISPTTVTFNILSIRASDGTISDTVTIGATRDGYNGLPGKLPITIEWKAGDTHLNNDTVVHYIYYRAGNTWWRLKDGVTSLTAPGTPVGNTNYQQLSSVETLVTQVIIAEQGNLAKLIFKDGKLISQKGTINGVESDDYSNPAFVPNALIDGENGIIKSNTIQISSVIADPDIPGDLQAKLTNNRSIYLEASGPVSYSWKEHKLPGNGTLEDVKLDGIRIEILAPYGCNQRIKFVPAHAEAAIFVDEPIKAVKSLRIAMGTRERIQLTAVWDRVYEVLDWIVTSRISYQIIGSNRVPNYFKDGDIIAKGHVLSSGSMSSIENRYREGISVSKGTGSEINAYYLNFTRSFYYGSAGTSISRALADTDVSIEVNAVSSGTTSSPIFAGVSRRYNAASGVIIFSIQFMNASGVMAANEFKFTLRANNYILNNPYLDANID